MVGIANTKETNDKVVEESAAEYKIKVIDEPNILLGMHITHNYENHTIRLSQTHYIHQILKEFDIENTNTVLMPMDPNVMQHKSNVGLVINKQNCISNATYISKLQDAAHSMGPNITYVTVTMAQFAKNPSQENWTGVKRNIEIFERNNGFCTQLEQGGIGNQSSPSMWMQMVQRTRTTN